MLLIYSLQSLSRLNLLTMILSFCILRVEKELRHSVKDLRSQFKSLLLSPLKINNLQPLLLVNLLFWLNQQVTRTSTASSIIAPFHRLSSQRYLVVAPRCHSDPRRHRKSTLPHIPYQACLELKANRYLLSRLNLNLVIRYPQTRHGERSIFRLDLKSVVVLDYQHHLSVWVRIYTWPRKIQPACHYLTLLRTCPLNQYHSVGNVRFQLACLRYFGIITLRHRNDLVLH